MDPYDEEVRASFITGMHTTIAFLEKAIEQLKDAKAAAVANDVRTAFRNFLGTMDDLEDFLKRCKKEPRWF